MPGQIDISSVIGLMEQAASQNAQLVNSGHSNSNKSLSKALAANGPRLAEEKKKEDELNNIINNQPGKKSFLESKSFKPIDIESMVPVSPDLQAEELDKHSSNEQIWAMKAYELALQPSGGSNAKS